jgi:peptide/nickel transport system ATP-binding protein
VSTPDSDIVLRVSGLSIDAPGPHGVTRLVDNVSFEVRRHEVFGIVGESGSGKSLTMLAVLGLLPPPLRVASGSIELAGRELTALSFEQMRAIRGKTMSIIFQDPMTSLNPVVTVGAQIGEAVRLHHPEMSGAQVEARALELMGLVGIPVPQRRYRQYPHEFSGGMRQRAMIAIALASSPKLLLADEPTTALDVTIQDQILRLLLRLRDELGMALVLVTHDLGVVAQTCESVAVMYAGRICETGRVAEVFAQPRHGYTKALLGAMPQENPEASQARSRLVPIQGQAPRVDAPSRGCAFAPRCSFVMPACEEGRPVMVADGGRRFACLAAASL